MGTLEEEYLLASAAAGDQCSVSGVLFSEQLPEYMTLDHKPITFWQCQLVPNCCRQRLFEGQRTVRHLGPARPGSWSYTRSSSIWITLQTGCLRGCLTDYGRCLQRNEAAGTLQRFGTLSSLVQIEEALVVHAPQIDTRQVGLHCEDLVGRKSLIVSRSHAAVLCSVS
jgi:hypothetical protein